MSHFPHTGLVFTRMIDGDRIYEMTASKDGRTYWAQTHCACKSTMSSGEWMPSVAEAVREARAGIEEHERIGRHAQPIDAHAAALAEMMIAVGSADTLTDAVNAVSAYVAKLRQQSQAAALGHTTRL